MAAVLLAFGSSYRRARMLSFLNPWADPQHNGYQLIQSQVGLAGGGPFGVGLGSSRAKWGFLPFAHTDFIFAIIGEELGLVGAAAVVGLFIAFGVLGIRIAFRAEHRFDAWLAVGITTWIVVQAFVNIGAVVGILPITGVPLPFISYGGTSLMVTLAAVGLLLNVARHPAPDRTGRGDGWDDTAGILIAGGGRPATSCRASPWPMRSWHGGSSGERSPSRAGIGALNASSSRRPATPSPSCPVGECSVA